MNFNTLYHRKIKILKKSVKGYVENVWNNHHRNTHENTTFLAENITLPFIFKETVNNMSTEIVKTEKLKVLNHGNVEFLIEYKSRWSVPKLIISRA